MTITRILSPPHLHSLPAYVIGISFNSGFVFLYLSRHSKGVHQLHNGMHGFMEKYPGKHFKGTLFTFDNRITMDFGGERDIVGICSYCDTKTETYRNCSNQMCNKKILVCDGCFDAKTNNLLCTDKDYCGR
jgi:predicted sulfurtransferase